MIGNPVSHICCYLQRFQEAGRLAGPPCIWIPHYFGRIFMYFQFCLGYWSHPGLCVGGTFPCPFPTRSHQSSYAHVASHVVPDPVRKPQSAYIYIYIYILVYIEMCMFISLHLYMYVYIYNHIWGSGAVRRLYCRPHADPAIDVNLVFWAWRHVK